MVYAYGDVSILGVLPSSLDNGVLPGGRKEADGVAPIDVFGGPLLGVVFPPAVDEDVRWNCISSWVVLRAVFRCYEGVMKGSFGYM